LAKYWDKNFPKKNSLTKSKILILTWFAESWARTDLKGFQKNYSAIFVIREAGVDSIAVLKAFLLELPDLLY